MGRKRLPPKLQRRNLLRVYLTDAQLKQLKLVARADGLDPSSWARLLVEREVQRAVS
jgi:hypothetical protein